MATITRKSVLLECLEYERGILKLCSQNHEGRIAAKGEEDLFHEQRRKIEILQEMIHALDSESVRKAMADWQKEVMEHGPSALDPKPYSQPEDREQWTKGEWPIMNQEPELKMTEGGI